MILQVLWKSLATISTCWWRQRGFFQEFLTCLVVVLCGLCRRIAQRNPSQRLMDRFCYHLLHCGKSEDPLGRHQNLLWKIALLPQPTADLRNRTKDFGFFSFTDVLPLNCADFVEIVCRLSAIAQEGGLWETCRQYRGSNRSAWRYRCRLRDRRCWTRVQPDFLYPFCEYMDLLPTSTSFAARLVP